MEKLRSLKQECLERITNPLPFGVQINDRFVRNQTIAPLLNSSEMPFYLKDDLIYLPEYYVSMERLKEINKSLIKKIPEDVNSEDLYKISLLKNGETPKKEEDFYTLAYIISLNKKYSFNFDEKGDVWIIKKQIKRTGISLSKSYLPRYFDYRINKVRET